MAKAKVLKPPPMYWKCPSCGKEDVTERTDVHTQFHECQALGGVSIPLVNVRSLDQKPKARQVAVQSEYGYNTAAVRTERSDGSNDVTVFAQPAVGRVDS